MKKTLLLLLALMTSSSVVSAPTSPKSLEYLSKGPSDNTARSLKKWRYFLKQYVTHHETNAANQEVNQIINKCYPSKRPACLDSLEYHTFIEGNPADYSAAIRKNQDVEKLVLKSADDLPDVFRIKDAQGKLIPGKVIIPKNIEEIVKKNNWKSALYKTKSTGGFDSGANLYIVAVPLGKGDKKWDKIAVLQTSPKPDNSSDNTKHDSMPKPANGDFTNAQGTLTVLTLDRTQKTPQSYMRRMYAQTNEVDPSKVAYGWDGNEVEKAENCISCHTGPFKPISPLGHGALHGNEKPMGDEQRKKVDNLNKILEEFVGWGTVSYRGREFDRGPKASLQPLGWAPDESETRTEDWLKACASEREPLDYRAMRSATDYSVHIPKDPSATIRYGALAEAMNCYSCHNGVDRGAITENFSSKEIKFKIAVHQNMPRGGVQLTNDERLALINCLPKEKVAVAEEWKKKAVWLSPKQCQDTTINKNCQELSTTPSELGTSVTTE